MGLDGLEIGGKSRLAALPEHFGRIKDPREPQRVALPLPEVLLLVVCGSVADCDDYDAIAAWGKAPGRASSGRARRYQIYSVSLQTRENSGDPFLDRFFFGHGSRWISERQGTHGLAGGDAASK